MKTAWLLLLLAIASSVMLFRLDRQPIQNWDEGIHGSVSLQMLEYNDWVTPHFSDKNYFRKPPLKFWIGAAVFKWFGVNAWTLRLPSAIAGILTVLLIGWWMWQWRRSRIEAFIAGAIFATMRPIFFHVFRTGETDGLLVLFITGALYAWWRTTNTREHRQQWWLVLSSSAIGAAILTKSAAGLIPLMLIAGDFILSRRWNTIPWRMWVIPGATFLGIILPWHLVMHLRHGQAFWDDYVGFHIIKRVTTVLHTQRMAIWWYFPTIWQKFVPYIFWAIGAIVYAFVELRRTRDPMLRFLLLWVFLVLLVFTIAQSKAQWYIFPLYPALIMLLTRFLVASRTMKALSILSTLHLFAIALYFSNSTSFFAPDSRPDQIIEAINRFFVHPGFLTIFILLMLVGVGYIAKRFEVFEHTVRIFSATLIGFVLLHGSVDTLYSLKKNYTPHPFTAITAVLAQPETRLIAYGINFDSNPAAEFILRQTLQKRGSMLIAPQDAIERIAQFSQQSTSLYLLAREERTLHPALRDQFVPLNTYGNYRLWQRREEK